MPLDPLNLLDETFVLSHARLSLARAKWLDECKNQERKRVTAGELGQLQSSQSGGR